MAKKHFKIKVDEKSLNHLFEHYGENMATKAIKVTNKYTNKIVRESKEIIHDYMYRDTGRLINSIKPSLYIYADKIVGEVNAGAKYARFIHDGARHPKGDPEKTERFFVPFKAAPSLYKWAKRHKVIHTVNGVDEYFDTGQTVSPDTGGLLVHIVPAKYFEKPFNEYKDKFVEEMSNILNET